MRKEQRSKLHCIDDVRVQSERSLLLYRRAFPDESTDALDQTGRLIREFAVVDPQSTAFRYPIDLKGNPSLPGLRSIDLVNLRDAIGKMDMLLRGARTHAHEHLQWKLEMKRECRDDNYY